ncbi:hypothetical protein ID263_004475 [Escherichia coli]|nr:hypothetical protein [Escherichia coli]
MSVKPVAIQFFEISDLNIVTMIGVGAQIMSDYDRLMDLDSEMTEKQKIA